VCVHEVRNQDSETIVVIVTKDERSCQQQVQIIQHGGSP